jgi:hypothetical protein
MSQLTVYANSIANPNHAWESHIFLLQLAFHLKDNYSADLVIGSTDEVKKLARVEEYNCDVSDCELLVHDSSNDTFKLVSFSESATSAYVNVIRGRNSKNDIVVGPHVFANWGGTGGYDFKSKTAVLFAYSPHVDPKSYYAKRRLLVLQDSILDKMYFRCTTGRGSEHLLHESEYVNERHPGMQYELYLANAMKYKCGISIASGSYELCHRDIEYMSIGLPMLRLEYIYDYDPAIKPGHHYISIDRGNFTNRQNDEHLGGEDYVKAYIDKFLEVKDDNNQLLEISSNAYDYVTSVSGVNRINHFLNLIEL